MVFWTEIPDNYEPLTPPEDPFVKRYRNDSDSDDFFKNLYQHNTIEDSSDSDYNSEPEIKTIISTKLERPNPEKHIRLWIPERVIDYNVPKKWEYFINHIDKIDEIINNKKMNSEYTSNKNFSQMFKEINDSYKKHCPNEYSLLNSQIILQHRLEFFMNRHTQLLNTF